MTLDSTIPVASETCSRVWALSTAAKSLCLPPPQSEWCGAMEPSPWLESECTCHVLYFGNVPPLFTIVLYSTYVPESWHTRHLHSNLKGIACTFRVLFRRGHFSIIHSRRTLIKQPFHSRSYACTMYNIPHR